MLKHNQINYVLRYCFRAKVVRLLINIYKLSWKVRWNLAKNFNETNFSYLNHQIISFRDPYIHHEFKFQLRHTLHALYIQICEYGAKSFWWKPFCIPPETLSSNIKLTVESKFHFQKLVQIWKNDQKLPSSSSCYYVGTFMLYNSTSGRANVMSQHRANTPFSEHLVRCFSSYGTMRGAIASHNDLNHVLLQYLNTLTFLSRLPNAQEDKKDWQKFFPFLQQCENKKVFY